MPNSEITIIIPAKNESLRIPRTLSELTLFLASDEGQLIESVYIVNDGSTDSTAEIVKECAKSCPKIKLLNRATNCGKGFSIREAWRLAETPWILVADADYSTDWNQLSLLWIERGQGENVGAVIGSRSHGSAVIERHPKPLRSMVSKLLKWLVKLLFTFEVDDTQCGFKLIRNDKNFREAVLNHLTVNRFAWDIEMLSLAKQANYQLTEVGIKWSHQDNSQVRLIRDGFEMLLSILKIKYRSLAKESLRENDRR